MRAAGAEHVLLPDGTVVLEIGDPYYHLRLARHVWAHFPDWLTFDPLLAHPHGAAVPWPPGYDLWVGGTVRLLGGGEAALWRAAAWWPVGLGALTLLPVFGAGRALAGVAAGLVSAALLALLPAAVSLSRVGYGDHHAAVTLLGAVLLWAGVRTIAERRAGVSAWRPALVLALARAALVVTWSGSLAYLLVGDGALAAAALVRGRAPALRIQSASLLVTALLVAPFAARSPAAIGGPLSPIELSWLHVAVCGLGALWAGVCARDAGRAVGLARGKASALRLGRAALWAAAAAGLLLLLPETRRGLVAASGFLSKADFWAQGNPEQAAAWTRTPGGGWLAVAQLGWQAAALPAVALALWARALRGGSGGERLVVALWLTGFGALGASQIRFAGDLAPAAAVAMGWAIVAAARWLGRGRRRATAVIAAAGVALALGPAVLTGHGARVTASMRAARAAPPPGDPALATVSGTLHRFAQTVRAVTPETPGFDDPSQRPAYGVLASPSFGHTLHAVAHRATPSDNFGPYASLDGLLATLEVLRATDESAAVRTLRELRTPWVLTHWTPGAPPDSLLHRLHQDDGRRVGPRPAWRRFRLVAEGPVGGLPFVALALPDARPMAAPYKLFEGVEGAVLRVEAPPGTRVLARVRVAAPSGRSFEHATAARAGDDGAALLRVPYATRTSAPVHPTGPYRIEIGGAPPRILTVDVEEADVREGRVIPVPEPAPRDRG